MKTLEQLAKAHEAAKSKLKAAKLALNRARSRDRDNVLRTAKKKAKFRIGDIIRYNPEKPPILVTHIECYSNGEPTYRGLEVCSGVLTRNMRSSYGHGTQNPYFNGLKERCPEQDWVKVGDCRSLRQKT